ncbi:Kef-type potassium/proton antiporter, CPA2 family [Sphingomonas laterariae]|uniref:Kef-type potassium/proton antiporter, CPA2 family n=1 Tax=Edaphosphingomonas laterariae TaxID=861865 RepID=A0A239GA62_9SPHN|nr:YbaL family putative K(+) efflux transporter [Sphingomonas laterariae]SNS66216.1 Kef-type potassium/proton antiporter, CPA2 family [Sphingomonas laterariae]
MPHVTPLIGTIVAGLVLAFILGQIAFRLRLSPLIGYLLAGIAVGPFTPGYVADQSLANELAELGVILLMFGVGLHFSVKHLMAVRRIAVPGAIGQITVATLLGMGLAWWMGWSMAGGFVFGLALSVASTVVLLRALQERRIVDTERGQIAVGWLIVEDLVMVLALVMIPAIATGGGGSSAILQTLAVTIGKVIAFVAFMLIVGRRAVPWMLHSVAHSGSRELFRLAVLAIALGVAFGAAILFGVSFALGAFFAGMILAESPLSQRAAEETLPLRDAFAVLFFVSVGMLFNPAIVTDEPLALAITVAIIMFGKSVAAFLIVRAFGRSNKTALTIAASLAQIGEFSFILATLGFSLKLVPADGRDLILAGAIISIMLNPLLFSLIDRFANKLVPGAPEAAIGGTPPAPTKGHVILVGHGRVGRLVAAGLVEAGEKVTVIEAETDKAGLPTDACATVLVGEPANGALLREAGIEEARLLFVAIPESFEAGQIVEQARTINPKLRIVARAHGDAEVEHLESHGADRAIMGEREIARQMLDEALIGI